MKQEEKEQQLRDVIIQECIDKLKLMPMVNECEDHTPYRGVCQNCNSYYNREIPQTVGDAIRCLVNLKSEAAKAYHQQKRFVRTENGTTLLELVFRKVDEHIKLENTNGWWEEYKGLMLKAEQEQTESVNLDELRKKFYQDCTHCWSKTEDDDFLWKWIESNITPHLQPQEQKKTINEKDYSDLQNRNIELLELLKEQKQSDAVEFMTWVSVNYYRFDENRYVPVNSIHSDNFTTIPEMYKIFEKQNT